MSRLKFMESYSLQKVFLYFVFPFILLFFFVCILILVFLFSLLMPERRDERAKKKRGSWTGRREEKKTCYGHFGWPFLQCWMFLSAFFCFYACNFNLWWFESGGGKSGGREKCGSEGGVVLTITHDAITTRPDLRHLGWAPSARLRHRPAYLMSKESSCLLVIA